MACLLTQEKYKPGGPPPSSYLAWHEWAEAQWKAGLRQKECGRCGKWKFPQELSGEEDEMRAFKSDGSPVVLVSPVCSECTEDA